MHHLRPVSSLLWVASSGIEVIGAEEVTLDCVGEKAFGLATLPAKWTLPFFVISDELFDDYVGSRNTDYLFPLKKWSDVISSAAQRCGISPDDLIIVRSNAHSEGLEDRGRFVSESGIFQEWPKLVKRCFDDFIEQVGAKNAHMPVIVQKRIVPLACGHISNERRVAEEVRDWRGEIEAMVPRAFTVSLRSWRKRINVASYFDSALTCQNSNDIKSALSIPCTWATEQLARVHFEWLYDGDYVYIVQADEEKRNHGIDPTKIIPVSANNDKKPSADFPRCLHLLRAEDMNLYKDYAKIQNPLLYHCLGLSTAPLYVLDDESTLELLSAGIVAPDLEFDLRVLSSSLLIIRTDIATGEKDDRQLLPRTDSIKDVAEAKKWLCDNYVKILEGGFKNAIFILHNYIPAFSSAFAYASPGDKLVRIESLWGMPEGLYYYSHDKHLIDTKVPDVAKANCEDFSVSAIKHYKKYVVFPEKDGKWDVQCLKPPYDWKPAIPHDEWIKEIAHTTRIISEKEGKSVSVMWFVGVDRERYGCDVFPWHHEPFEYIDHSVAPRNKLSFEKTIVIHTLQDLEELENYPDKNIRSILIQPTDAAFLRDRRIIARLGISAKAIGANIWLEGGILSHAYYQLVRTGAKVEVKYPFERYQQQEFNKLVRDRIPEKIQRNGEEAITVNLEKRAFSSLLKRKLVEEALEVLDSKSDEDLIIELADVLEVIDGILSQHQIDLKTVISKKDKKREQSGGFEEGVFLKKTSNQIADSIGKVVDTTPVETAQRISKSTDLRRYPSANESLTRIKVPVTLDRWEVRPSVKAENIDIVLKGERKQGVWQIDVSVFEEAEQLSFFDK